MTRAALRAPKITLNAAPGRGEKRRISGAFAPDSLGGATARPELLSRVQLARRMDVKTRTVTNWLHDGCPSVLVGRERRYPWHEVQRWYVAQQRGLGRKAATADGTEDAKARRAVADARLAEIALAKAERQLLPVAEVDAQVSDLLLRLQAKLATVPSKYAARVVDLPSVGAAMAVLDGAVQEILAELHLVLELDEEDA